MEDHTMLHKVQIRDQVPTVFHDIVLLPEADTVIHDIELVLGDPRPTVSHEVELTYIGRLPGDPEESKYEILATGEIIEPELLI